MPADKPYRLTGQVDRKKAGEQATMLAGRVQKNFRRLAPGFQKTDTTAFRLYDRDIPEVRAVVDWYDGHAVVGEYARRQTEEVGDWLELMGEAVAKALGLSADCVHLRRRKAGTRYAANPEQAGRGQHVVREHGLRYYVNLDNYLDVGLFCDQRIARARLMAESDGGTVLNLFAYTGSFSVAALAGGARHVTSVDLSRPYLDWTQDNLRLNELPLERHEPVKADAFAFLKKAAAHGRRWSIVMVDPPSRSTAGGPRGQGFDVLRDHPGLLELCRSVKAPGGYLAFSTNHQRFETDEPVLLDTETTESTVPPDFRNRQVHRSWRIE